MTTPGLSLTCSECGFVNEVERVYCHNCGTRLDRSALPRDDDTKAMESLERTRQRVKKMTNPGKTVLRRELIAGAKVFGSAILAAVVILLIQAPEGVPDAKAEGSMRMIKSEVSEAIDSGQPRQLVFTEQDINSYLKNALKTKTGAGSIPGVTFDRAFVQMEPEIFRVGLQHSFWGFAFYSRIAYKFEKVDGYVKPVQAGGSFGKLSVPSWIMKFMDFGFKPVWGGLKREGDQLKHLQSVTLVKGRGAIVIQARK